MPGYKFAGYICLCCFIADSGKQFRHRAGKTLFFQQVIGYLEKEMWYAFSAQSVSVQCFRDLPNILPHSQFQPLFLDIPTSDAENRIVSEAIFLAQHHAGVSYTGNTGRAGHIVEDIAAIMLFTVVVDKKNAHLVIVGDLLQR